MSKLEENFDKIVLEIIDEIYKNSDEKWQLDCKYINYRRKLEIDERGQFGKKLVITALKNAELDRLEYGIKQRENWIKVDNKKYKIKTTSLDKANKFQNENFKKEDKTIEGVIIIAVAPDQLYIKCVKYNKIPFDIMNNREEAKTGAGSKWDIKKKDFIPIKEMTDIWDTFKKAFIEN